MVVRGVVKKGEYFDSISLMTVARELNELGGIIDSAVIMGTRENKSILKSSGLLLPEFNTAEDTDLIVAIKSETEDIADSVLSRIDEYLKQLGERGETTDQFLPKSIEGALQFLPDANLALISVAGKYASIEAQKALKNGLHVMLFSDNVSLENEIELKKYAKEKGLLLMGPDCGTAIINGVPLAFANVVNGGNVGIIAASGTGLQEVSCIISNRGSGISQAIGTGGRDIKNEVGGLMFIEAIKMLSSDPDTKVMLLISKPPDTRVIEKIAFILKDIKKPVVAVFLGAEIQQIRKDRFNTALTLEEGALIAVALSLGKDIDSVAKMIDEQYIKIKKIAEDEAKKLNRSQKYIRALFSGGTFCYEAQILFRDALPGVYSNVPSGYSHNIKYSFKSEKHTVVDLGNDEFTTGRLHPMIDYSIRSKRIIDEAIDPETAVILLDIVLGYGSNPNPLSEIIPVIEKAKIIAEKGNRYLSIICSVIGTDQDPQNWSEVVNGLKEAGVLVMESNAAACNLAAFTINNIQTEES
ncbi:MAG: acyl-CoA synthetase FdrA [Candidatus Marinimicrobia bacterium]|nr:acyl-CoA synthetase FdrA [Candidatus Neomarinimicrobiota bacterium]